MTMNDNTNRERQFLMTLDVIGARVRAQINIDRIMENMVKNYHPITEERYQFVL
jgi:hypothetical protein